MLESGVYRFRQLHPADAPRLWALDQRCFPPGIAYSREEMAAVLRARADPYHWAVETMPGSGSELAGFVLAQRSGRRGHVITLDVAAAHRRRGLGVALMRAAERHFANLGLEGMRLEVSVANRPALCLYARLGYRTVRVLPGYYARDLDALLLHKDWPGVS